MFCGNLSWCRPRIDNATTPSLSGKIFQPPPRAMQFRQGVDCDLVVALVRTNIVDVAVDAKSALGPTGDMSG